MLRLNAVGDFILTTPAIREVRMNFPDAYITLVVSKIVAPMAELCPYVNEVVPFNQNFNRANFLEVFINVTRFARDFLWKRNYDLGFSFYHLGYLHFTDLIMLYLSGARERVSYVMESNNIYTGNLIPKEENLGYYLLTHPILSPKEICHFCAKMLYLLTAYGLKIHRTDLEIWYNKKDFLKAQNLIKGFAPGRIKIALGITSNGPDRKYPAVKYLEVLKVLIANGASVVIFGGNKEFAEAKFLEDNLPEEYVINLTKNPPGRRVDAALMSLLDLYIGNFTGTADMATAAKLPVIMISPTPAIPYDKNGVTTYGEFFPWQAQSIVLSTKSRSQNISQIEPKEIVEAFQKMMYFIKNSELKKISCPPVVRGMNGSDVLKFGFEFDNDWEVSQ